ncbi:DinB family protein [Paenibacillus sp. 481]|uniref:DinB family protein n=1 Tax=Paenibacillus sp. 481 TaxID=2835869 RepID=UPI001E511993|nr:DinB family protein [Paenibacillus sp. 481]UHA72345.1 DinB family protein [Paenibacillus sp. 481]
MNKRHEVLFNQLDFSRKVTLDIVEFITEEQANIIPTGFNNNIRWNLGHIFVDQYLWIQHLTKERIEIPDGYLEWFNYGTSPANWDSSIPDLQTLTQLLEQQPAFIRATYAERLEQTFSETELGMNTISQVLVRTIYHEGLHTGAIQALRKFV